MNQQIQQDDSSSSSSSSSQGKVNRFYQIVSTCYDNRKQLFKKYPESRMIVEKLISHGVQVHTNIDATQLHHYTFPSMSSLSINSQNNKIERVNKNIHENQDEEEQDEEEEKEEKEEKEAEIPKQEQTSNVFLQLAYKNNIFNLERDIKQIKGVKIISSSNTKKTIIERNEIEEENEEREKNSIYLPTKIIFNFPHTGCGIKDTALNIQSNQNLIRKFFASVIQFVQNAQFATHFPEIHLTIKEGEPYDQWNISQLVKETKILCIKNVIPFFTKLYPHYTHRRTIGYNEIVSPDENEDIVKGARTWIIDRKIEESEKPKKEEKKGKKKKKEREKTKEK